MRRYNLPGDRALLKNLLAEIPPVSLIYGGRRVTLAELSPQIEREALDETRTRTLFSAALDEHMTLRVERVDYADFPAAEWTAFVENHGEAPSALLEDFCVFDGALRGENPVLLHGNGDTCDESGYEWFREPVTAPIAMQPTDGTSCRGAFPYMRLCFDGFCVNLAVGWPAQWRAELAPAPDGAQLRVRQARCRMVVRPGETMRTPRMALTVSEGGDDRARNLWRRWYLAHVLPRTDGGPPEPRCFMHLLGAAGMPDFTGATEENQLHALNETLRRGLHPDVWWIDAGWYPCAGVWTTTGTWKPSPKRFPRGLAPLGARCAEAGMEMLLWFEPERVRENTEWDREHPEWLLFHNEPDGSLDPNRLVNLGDPAVLAAVTDRIDAILKESRASIYRQDFNFDPEPFWVQNEADDRVGALENLHVQGYLALWDALRARNPGLWIDSCASGGRRNDLETMRRAVPLHYTDVGYGNHPIKQKQHRQMFEWLPYFRAHNMNWDDPETGEYSRKNRLPDEYSDLVAMAPALTDMTAFDAPDEAFALSARMQPLWRRAAKRMMEGDYYPLTECRKSREDFYAMQFHDPDRGRGFFEVVSNNRNPNRVYPLRLKALSPKALYRVSDGLTGETVSQTGEALMGGVEIELSPRSGKLCFYEEIKE